ncbi:Acetyltransferase (GNAT) family protein [Cohaesibacter marisflavi]|uniref:Acetyltransferase (GNAT) family protein n=1 Tax=Cohaesibacter marisflavi TaxID=655353 RepID=A0A1I5H7V3_9HYPH|nr:GNAT family N-acetyltransferase [Cohaesibacter marisflavi]SFO44170.1 Acetyltransferase (GNAT) family protein [Cohaesibacter marisflavi]
MTSSSDTTCDTNGASVSFRLAKREDAALIHQMVADLANYLDEAGKHTASVADYEIHGFGDRPRFEAIIAEVAGDAVGMCLFFDSFSTWAGKPGLYVQDLYVSPKARGLKLGRLLLEQVAQHGLAKGYAYVRLSVDANNVNAQGFYEACGLEWSDTERLYVARGDAFAVLAGN